MEIIILAVLGGFSWLASLGLDRLLKHRLRIFQAERVYIIPGFFRQPLLLVALVLIPLEIVLPLAWLIRPVDGIEIGLGLGLPALMLPPFTLESFFITALFFLPFGIFFPILVVIAYRQTIHPEKPNRFVLHRDRIEVFYPHHRQECYQVRDLESVRLIPIQSTLKGSYDGVRVVQLLTHHERQLYFSDGKTIKLPPNRLSLFKQTLENLRRIFRDLYGI